MTNRPEVVKTIEVEGGWAVTVEPAPACFVPRTYTNEIMAETIAAELAFRTDARLVLHDDPDGVLATIALDAAALADQLYDEESIRRGHP